MLNGLAEESLGRAFLGEAASERVESGAIVGGGGMGLGSLEGFAVAGDAFPLRVVLHVGPTTLIPRSYLWQTVQTIFFSWAPIVRIESTLDERVPCSRCWYPDEGTGKGY